MINPPFITDQYYHIYNRGVEKRTIFQDKWDYLRFLETLDYYRNSPQPMKLSDFRRGVVKFNQIKNQKEILRILVYCLMPNHFHLLVQQKNDQGITEYLRKTTNSYTRYFNTKYDRVGPLLQGTFKAKLVGTDEYLLQLSKYIHRNPFKLSAWKSEMYPYSSYSYYISKETHPFCTTDFILAYFSSSNPNGDYKAFVENEDIDMSEKSFADLLIDSED